MSWQENEDGPECGCGNPTIVKMVNGKAILMCFFHTSESGAYFPLPEDRPDDWPWTTKQMGDYLT